jgi:ssDNA-binding replication factor A large subunit
MDFIQVKDLKAQSKPGINIIVRVIAKTPPRSVRTKYGRSRVCDVKVADETGAVNLSLWGSKMYEVEFGDLLKLEKVYCQPWQGRPQLTLGREGEMEKIEDDDFPDANTLLQKFAESDATEEV